MVVMVLLPPIGVVLSLCLYSSCIWHKIHTVARCRRLETLNCYVNVFIAVLESCNKQLWLLQTVTFGLIEVKKRHYIMKLCSSGSDTL